MAIKKDGKINMSIHVDTLLEENETLLVVGEQGDIQKCFHI